MDKENNRLTDSKSDVHHNHYCKERQKVPLNVNEEDVDQWSNVDCYPVEYRTQCTMYTGAM